MSLGHEKLFYLHIVFNYPIMNHGNAAVLAQVRMRVHIVGLPVGGPAGMAYPQNAIHGPTPVHKRAEYLQPALGFFHLQPALFRQHRNARRIVAPVLQMLKPIQQYGRRLLPANISHNTAHGITLPLHKGTTAVNFKNGRFSYYAEKFTAHYSTALFHGQ